MVSNQIAAALSHEHIALAGELNYQSIAPAIYLLRWVTNP